MQIRCACKSVAPECLSLQTHIVRKGCNIVVGNVNVMVFFVPRPAARNPEAKQRCVCSVRVSSCARLVVSAIVEVVLGGAARCEPTERTNDGVYFGAREMRLSIDVGGLNKMKAKPSTEPC